MNCRFCDNPLTHVFADLGTAPPSNSFLTREQLEGPEIYYPLKAFVCERCFLVQLDELKKSTEIFSNDYVYFSGISRSWLAHSKNYVEMIVKRLSLARDSFVVEVASNDGYLLQYVREKGIPCLGIEPTSGTAALAKKKGIPVLEAFFGASLAERLVREGKQADLIVGNNVLPHVPDINDFVRGLKIALKPGGTITMEFPHLMRLVEYNLFDTIYHEHFSYLSLTTAREIFRRQGLEIYDAEELATHGGSLRVFACHAKTPGIFPTPGLSNVLAEERRRGLDSPDYYHGFVRKMEKVKTDFLRFLLDRKAEGCIVAAYGAAAKGNTLLNYCGIKADLIEFVCDRAESKQGRFLPGSRIPVVSEEWLEKRRPDYVVVFPWNIRSEIEEQLDYIRSWNARFVVAVPELTII